METVQTARFRRFAWTTLGYNLAVIVWGAFVRATGSGAGCGSHWPLCNGVVVPRDPGTATMIEFVHRATSGLALLAVIGLVVWAFRAYPPRSFVRRAAVTSLVLILIEALLGAGLVLLEYVEMNKSLGRAVYLSAHLTNTLLLTAGLFSVAWAASRPGYRLQAGSARTRLAWALALALLASVSGAVAALGDTVFPSTSLVDGLRADFHPDSHALLRLRLFHPLLAVLAGIYFLWLGTRLRARMLLTITAIQLAMGVVNVLLLAPVWMQLTHLFAANLLWLSLVSLLLEDAPADRAILARAA